MDFLLACMVVVFIYTLIAFVGESKTASFLSLIMLVALIVELYAILKIIGIFDYIITI